MDTKVTYNLSLSLSVYIYIYMLAPIFQILSLSCVDDTLKEGTDRYMWCVDLLIATMCQSIDFGV